MQWYYFHREADRAVLMKEGNNVPPRPEDANPATEGPMTPWYRTLDHLDDSHVHVRAENAIQACEKVAVMLVGCKIEVQASKGSPCTRGPVLRDR